MHHRARKAVCLSHVTDVDGLASAALVKMALDAEVRLADYGDLLKHLHAIRDVSEFYLCDLGMSAKTAPEFLDELRRIARFAKVSYIDHHQIDDESRTRIKQIGVDLTHSTDECAAVLTYLRFRRKIPRNAGIIALYGAVTDYLDSAPVASELLDRFDRQFVLFEAALLSHALNRSSMDKAFPSTVVEALSKLEYPHRIQGALDYAKEQAELVSSLMSTLKSDGVRMKKFAYAEAHQTTSGTTANLLRGVFNVPVGVAYKVHKDEGVFEASLRASDRYRKNLGAIASSAAAELEGFGGGHPKASGVRIPLSQLKRLIDLLDQKL